MEDYIKDKKGDEEIKSALSSGNFKMLYEYVIKQSMLKDKLQSNTTSGKWVKYEQGSDYNILRDSLQGYYTGWCTAAGENFAKSQLANGDFYVYYTLDNNGEAKVPRIAIRMDGKDKIGEIRGIADNQNMEPEMMSILEEKLKELMPSASIVRMDQDTTRNKGAHEKIIEKLSEDVELLILLNPNNPIGNVYTNQEFEMILEAAKKYEISILIDEAYMYFYDNTFIDYALNNPHILVTRTFSKLFSLGSLRLGYVVGQPQDVKMISNLCTPHNTNAFAMRFAKAILEKDGMLDMLIKNQLEGKEYIINALKKNGFVVNAKEGNFKPRKVDADIIVERMKQEKKILIKSYSEIGTLGKCLRVTTGEKIYMEKFLEALLDIDK